MYIYTYLSKALYTHIYIYTTYSTHICIFSETLENHQCNVPFLLLSLGYTSLKQINSLM